MHTDGKVKIIQAAQRLIAKQGVEKTSMRNIAEEAGITTGAIYYYYKSKEELLYDVMDFSTAITSTVMKMRYSDTAVRDDVLDEVARQVIQRLLKDSGINRLRFYLAYQAALGDEALRAKFLNDYAAQTERTAQLFNYIFETDSKPQDLSLAVIMIAAMDGINLQQYIGALPVDIDELSKIYNEFFAFSVPLFQKHFHEIHRFDHIQSTPSSDKKPEN